MQPDSFPLTESAPILASAARVTLEGAAEVTLSQSYDLDEMEPGTFRMAGTAAFALDRCRLVGNGEVVVFDGEDEYRLGEGRWRLRPSAPGRRSSTDPTWLLRLLADEQGVQDLRDGPDGEIHGELAYEPADATVVAGIFQGWTLPFTVLVVDGSVRTAHLEMVDRVSGRVGTVSHLELKPVPSVAPIELPPQDAVVTVDIAAEIAGD
jgi:hypothetical protein